MDQKVSNRAERQLQKRLAFLREAVAPERPLRIVDVGANPINTPGYNTLLLLGGCEVWGFEPEADAFAALQDNPVAGAHYINKAVGKPGRATFYHHPQSGLGSLYPVRQSSVAYLGHPGWYKPNPDTSPVDLVPLDEVSELPQVDLVKIDIQGGELDVFQSGRAKMADAVCVITEARFFRIYEGEPMWGDVDCELRDQGFALHKLEFAKSAVVANSLRGKMGNKAFRNQLIDGDAIYIRDPETIADWSDEQVKQLAVASATVFHSYDLTVLCLDELVARGAAAADVPQRFFDLLPNWIRNPG